ncbi:23S rRNA (adenine(2503)-C(2))-methyltransferase RlmN [Rubripirellula amarantea]|nr:23S rRNA (adenine(2503)-C(2))-methyltransferase RlmN [Rubripirellula amarantea]
MNPKIDLYDVVAVEQLRRQRRLDPQLIRQLRNRFLKRFDSDEAALEGFPEASRISLHSLELFRRFESGIDGATKLLFRTSSDLLIESVLLRIATGRNTLCVSSQVGCAAACGFCATGKMGIARNLSVAEILDQVQQCGQVLASEGRRLQNIVFMGMGEPFHNECNLFAAVERLVATDHFNRSPASILVSTVGVADAMLRFAEQFPKVNLALSLHSASQEKREQIIPLAKKYSLQQLRETLVEINQVQKREFMIEYLMLAGVNDSTNDAIELIRWLEPMQVHVNLIPYNPIQDAPHLHGSSSEVINRFATLLKAEGLKTTIRYSLGSDIAAACGQLVRSENRQRVMNRMPQDQGLAFTKACE